VNVQPSSGNIPVHTVTQVTCCSGPNISSTALFLQRSCRFPRKQLCRQKVSILSLVMDTSSWQPTCLVPCQPTSCRRWANRPAPHLGHELTAGSSPGNCEKNPQQILSKKNLTFLNFSPVFKIPGQMSLSSFQQSGKSRGPCMVTSSSTHTCSSAETGTDYRIQFTLLTYVENWHSPLLLPTQTSSDQFGGREGSQHLRFYWIPASTCNFSCMSRICDEG